MIAKKKEEEEKKRLRLLLLPAAIRFCQYYIRVFAPHTVQFLYWWYTYLPLSLFTIHFHRARNSL